MQKFSYNNLELAKMTEVQEQDICTGHKLAFCQILASYIFHYKIWPKQKLCIFKQ